MTAADGYLADNGNAMKAEDETGSEPEQLYRFVSEGTPVTEHSLNRLFVPEVISV